jgi:hypothetical protein
VFFKFFFEGFLSLKNIYVYCNKIEEEEARKAYYYNFRCMLKFEGIYIIDVV